MVQSAWRSAGALGLFTGLVALAAAVGARVTGSGTSRWYRQLNKPPFQPPPALFGPVWTGLYALMVWSAFRVWGRPSSPARSRALRAWTGQLALNGAWSPLFFGAHRPKAALADLALLGPAVAVYTRRAADVDRGAAWMMAPYLGWLGFATLLNEEIVRRNRAA
jgi:benzodiazapine receptor